MDLSKVGLLVHTHYMQFKRKPQQKNALFLSVNVFSMKVLITDTIFYGTAILRAHLSHAKFYPFGGQRQYLHFSVILGWLDTVCQGQHLLSLSINYVAIDKVTY